MMTVDDENSIYVGGIPYDCSEDELRCAFELYGSIMAVKIINDRGIGGKCYAFVSFTNPRSSIDAINDMDGRTIRGRAIKVNNVKTRGAGGRSNYVREDFRRSGRGMGRGTGRGRDRDDNEHRREHYRDRSWEQEREREGGRDIGHEDDRGREQFDERNEGVARGAEESDRGRSRDRDSEVDRDRRFDRDREHSRDGSHGRTDKDKDHHSRERSRSRSYDKRSRELSSESIDYQHQLEEKKVLLLQRREELRKEVSEMDEISEQRKQLIADLQRKSLKLEDALSSAKKVSSLRQTQLIKLRKCFLHVKEYGVRLKNSEQELQDLVESVVLDMDVDIDGHRDGHLTNGKVR